MDTNQLDVSWSTMTALPSELTDGDYEKGPTWLIITLILLSSTTIIGNLLVLITVSATKQLRTLNYVFIISLILTDLCNGSFVTIPLTIHTALPEHFNKVSVCFIYNVSVLLIFFFFFFFFAIFFSICFCHISDNPLIISMINN